MSFDFGISVSEIEEKDAAITAGNAVKEAIAKVKEGEVSLLLALASTHFDQERMLQGIQDAAPDIPMIGCSTAGIITNNGIKEKALGILALASDTISFHAVKIENISHGMNKAGGQFADAIIKEANNKQKLVFIFPDALSGNSTEIVRGALERLGPNFPLMGGAAGDDMKFEKTYQYFNNELLTDAVVGFSLSGDVAFAVGADHGWLPISIPRTITKAEGTMLFELDGKPAFSIYEEYFKEKASDFKTLSLVAVQYPLGMKTKTSDKYMIRVPLSINDDGSIVCGAEVMEGATISLMIGSKESALAAAENTATMLAKPTSSLDPRLIFVSNCIARKILYGMDTEKEIDSIKKIFGQNSSLFGFYSYGQIAPFAENEKVDVKKCDPGFYEQSISLAAFGEQK